MIRHPSHRERWRRTDDKEVPLSTDENKALYRRYMAAILSKDASALDAVLAPDFVGHDLPPGLPPGPAALNQFRLPVEAAFPDLEGTIEDVIAEGDCGVGRPSLRGTHQGAFMGIPATGRTIRSELIEIVRIENGQIAERWVQRDKLGELQQLGAIPAPAPAVESHS